MNVAKFNKRNYHSICDRLAQVDSDLAEIVSTYGYPPFWSRPNTFETLVHIILEQQVSLASALAALNKLKERLTELSPVNVLALTDEEMKACYCSRQKTAYIRCLATAIVSNELDLNELEDLPDAEIRARLRRIKGVGHWTIDVYLIFVLRHANVFPIGDLAAVNALKRVKRLAADVSREDVLATTELWQPHRTVATMLLWHFYLSSRKKAGV